MKKDVRQRAFLHDLLVDQMVHSVSHDDGQQARCRMLHPGSQVRLLFGLVLSDRIRALLLPPEGGEHLLYVAADLVAVMFGYAFVRTTDGLYVYLMEKDTLYE